MSKIKQATKKSGRERKEQIVAELVEKFNSSSDLVFADYKGLTHRQLEDLKKELKKLDSTIVIAKNSLIKLSLGKSEKYSEFKENEGLNLPTATLFIKGDMVEPLKKVQKAIKDFGLPKIKFGILEGQLVDEAGVLKIASLPNQETLLAQLVGTLNSPIQGLAVVLNGNIAKFVMTLNAVARLPRPEPSDGGQAQSKPQLAEQPQSPQTPATIESTGKSTETQNSVNLVDESVPSVSASETSEQQTSEGGELNWQTKN